MKPKGNKASYATAAPFGTVVGEVYKLGTGVQAVEVPAKNAIDSKRSGSAARSTTRFTTRLCAAEQRKGVAHPGGEHRRAAQGQPHLPT
jgi:hypothetical protein